MFLISIFFLISPLKSIFGTMRQSWNHSDCITNRYAASFNGSCYHYDYEHERRRGGRYSPSLTDIHVAHGCQYCAYRAFKSYGQVGFDYGYPECVRHSGAHVDTFHEHCNNRLQSNYRQVLCCCDVLLCNDLFRSSGLRLPPPPPPSHSEETYEAFLMADENSVGLDEARRREITLKQKLDGHGYDLKSNCKYFDGQCYNYDFFNCPNGKSAVTIMKGCTFCVIQFLFDDIFTNIVDVYPLCVINNTYNGVTNFNDQCILYYATKVEVRRVDYMCCCKSLCNPSFPKIPISDYCATEESRTPAPPRNKTIVKPTSEPPVLPGFKCYGLTFNKSVTIYNGCKGCLRTTVYNIVERPFVGCMRPKLDAFDIFEQFCNEYFFDKYVLMYVHCCYRDLCNDINLSSEKSCSGSFIRLSAVFSIIIIYYFI